MAFTNKRLGAGSPLLTKEMLQSRLGTIPADKTVAEYINENKGIKIDIYDTRDGISDDGIPTAPCGPNSQGEVSGKKYTQDTLWLVQHSEGETAQVYDEYIVVASSDGTQTAYQWEKLGSHEIPGDIVTYDTDGNIKVGDNTYSFESVDVVLGDGSTKSYTLLQEVVNSNSVDGPAL